MEKRTACFPFSLGFLALVLITDEDKLLFPSKMTDADFNGFLLAPFSPEAELAEECSWA